MNPVNDTERVVDHATPSRGYMRCDSNDWPVHSRAKSHQIANYTPEVTANYAKNTHRMELELELDEGVDDCEGNIPVLESRILFLSRFLEAP
jgi:hypothetical protein